MNQRYPIAKQNVSGKMKIQGHYSAGHPRGAIVHFTAGGSDPVSTLEGGIANGYCFFVIAPNGDVYQNFDLDCWGSHAGKSFHHQLGNSVSQYLVGIEICNAGKVQQIDDSNFRPWFNDPAHYRQSNEPIPKGVPKPARDLKADEVRHVERFHNREAGWYHCYTQQQEAALIALLLWLKNNSSSIFNLEFVLGHDEVSPGRKNDPGGALSVTMPQLRRQLIAIHEGDGIIPRAIIVPEDSLESPLTPRLGYAPDRYFSEALALQKAINRYPGIKLTEDGYAGDHTSDAVCLLTGYYLPGDARASAKPVLPKKEKKLAVIVTGTRRTRIGRKIVEWEARRDKQGRIQVYQLPANDGGGRYEVAGINEKYDPEEAKKLAALVKAGMYQQVEDEAADYIAKNTDRVASLVTNAGLDAFLRDCTFNRGFGGATKILQLALKVSVTGGIGPATQEALSKLEKTKPVELLQDLRNAREKYERDYIGYRANFWKGLVNRWNMAHVFALELLRSEEAKSAATEVKLALSDEASMHSVGEDSKPISEPQDYTLPPLNFAPARYSIIAERFQEFANQIAALRLEEDGMAGEKTAAAFKLIFGYPLVGSEGETGVS